jgi:hypothetical protein
MRIPLSLGRLATLSLLVVSPLLAQTGAPAAKTLPTQLSDQEFWKFITDMSEPAGYFRSENLVSNETGLQWVIPALLAGPRVGRVYLGVGPEQNYTYIASLKPKMAIIFDVRRGNMFQHLLYKALFELSANRVEFIERLFSKPRATGLDTSSTAGAIAAAYWNVFGDSAIYKKNRDEVKELLARKHGFPLTEDDWIDLFWIYDQFYYNGLPITYSVGSNTGSGRGGGQMPDYRTIMEGTDGAGVNRGFLASEANWRVVKDLHAKNLIVPVVGNFGGPKAIKAVGAWLKERGALVGAFYASNVEQYLFQDGLAYRYYDNVSELPTDSASVIIRSGRGQGGFGGGGGMRNPNWMCPIETLLRVNREGRISVWGDVFNYCTQ